jgi:membrane-bound metal-dependent hydrolase YbcI (DUF457 family)
MKGITHFTVGIAFASCFPSAVQAGADGNPVFFILGGVCGLLPDTLDFKLLRFLHRHAMEVVTDPSSPDPSLIANALAHAITRTHETGKTSRIQLHTSQPGIGLWHQFRITLNNPARLVNVTHTGIVTTSRHLIHNQPHPPSEVSIPLPCAVTSDYTATTEMDIFSGPSYAFEPLPDGRVQARFIPWHRHWTHSIPVALVVGVIAGGLINPVAGVIAGGAWTLHALLDQCGFMGSNLLYPFTRRRSPGLQWVASGSTLGNLCVIWLSCLLVYWNLANGAPGSPSLVHLLLYAGALPLTLAAWLNRRLLSSTPDSSAAG